MTDEERITRLEHRVRELQTALVTVIRDLAAEEKVAASERGRLDEIRAKGDVPYERLIEMYSTPR
jgi:hypothetical protein